MIAIKNLQSVLQLLINFLDRWGGSNVVTATLDVIKEPLTLEIHPQQTSESGIDLLKRLEGFRDTPYFCSANHKTIGYGHVLKDGENFKNLTEKQAHNLLLSDLEHYEGVVRKIIRSDQLEINQNQFDALVCLVFNIGQTQFEKSKTLKCLKEKNHTQALIEWAGFNKHKDVKTNKLVISQGLVNRRLAEINLFKKKDIR